jgi:cob(I)alamin adenosyltransferase
MTSLACSLWQIVAQGPTLPRYFQRFATLCTPECGVTVLYHHRSRTLVRRKERRIWRGSRRY